jgi:hypothetical protein
MHRFETKKNNESIVFDLYVWGEGEIFDSIHNAFKTKKKTTYLIIKRRRRRSELNQIVDLSFSSTTKKN